MPRQSVTLAPFTAGATIFVHPYDRFDAKRTLDLVARCGVIYATRRRIVPARKSQAAVSMSVVANSDPLFQLWKS
jgi:hypothetical protein